MTQCSGCGSEIGRKWRKNSDGVRVCADCGDGPIYPVAARDDLQSFEGPTISHSTLTRVSLVILILAWAIHLGL